MTSIHPQLSHCGVYARDIARQIDFYTQVVGLVIADRGASERAGAEFVFLTGATGHHH